MVRVQLPPGTFFAGTPPHVRAYIEQLHATINDLHTRMAELESRQAKNSTNSSLPPSSEHPHAKPVPHTPKSLRRSGGRPGPAEHQRHLLLTEQCQQVIPCVPPTCRRCAAPLSGTDPELLRHQVWELPEIKPSVTEYQRHRLICRCGTVTCGALPAGVPTGQAGPRLIAFSGLLMYCFPPVEEAGRPLLEYDSQSTSLNRLDGLNPRSTLLANSSRRSRGRLQGR
jgi:transposase